MKRFAQFLIVLLATCVGLSQPAFAAAPTYHSVSATVQPATVQPLASAPSTPVLTGYTYTDSATRATRTVRTVRATPADGTFIAPDVGAQRSNEGRAKLIVGLIGIAFVGSIQSVAADKDTYPARDTVRQQLNQLIAWTYYIARNKMISTTTATFPALAIGTTTTKVKTTNATVLLNAGAVNAFGATDDAWTLTGAVLAVSSFRKYLCLADAADARTVIASSDASTAAGCVFSGLPADGLAIVGSILVATDGTHTFTPGTTALSATGITTTYFDGLGDDAAFPFALVTP